MLNKLGAADMDLITIAYSPGQIGVPNIGIGGNTPGNVVLFDSGVKSLVQGGVAVRIAIWGARGSVRTPDREWNDDPAEAFTTKQRTRGPTPERGQTHECNRPKGFR